MRKLLFAFMMLLLTAGFAQAQDTPAPFCGNLSAGDCAIVTDSAQAMRELESAAFHFNMDMSVGDFPGTEPSSISFRLSGQGAYAIEPGTLTAITLSPSELMQNFSQLSQMTEQTLQGISGDATLLLFFPQEMIQSASKSGTHLPSKVGLSLRLVDGIGYINLDKLAELDTSGGLPHGWIGIDLVDFFHRAMEQSDLSSSLTMPGLDPEMMNTFTDPDFLGQFISIERLDDAEVDGQTAGVFKTSIDLGALYSSEEYQSLLRQQLEALEGADFSDEELQNIMEMYATLYDGFVIDMTQTIGLDDQYVHAMDIAFDWTIDFGEALAGIAGSDSDANVTSQPIHLTFGFQGELSQFNHAPAITAPENAHIIPTDELFGEMNDMMSKLTG